MKRKIQEMNEELFFHALYKAVSGKVEHYLLALCLLNS